MNAVSGLNATQQQIAERYEKDGFVVPLDVLNTQEARALRTELETIEAEVADDPELAKLVNSYPDRLIPSFDAIIRHPKIIEAVNAVLGPDLMVWSGALFIKPAKSNKIVSWHQDLTYWGLDDAEEVTVWVALSKADLNAGCMKFVPGSHKQRIVPHNDTKAADNMLSRGQEVAVDVDEDDAVVAALDAGQASLHHGHLFHSSGPNFSDDRRIGMAVRYIKPAMKQETGDKSLVALVSGVDEFGHFTVADSPKGTLHPDDIAQCKRDADLKSRLLF